MVCGECRRMLQATREEEEHAAGPEKRKSMLRATSIRESIIFEEVRRVVKSIIFEEGGKVNHI